MWSRVFMYSSWWVFGCWLVVGVDVDVALKLLLSCNVQYWIQLLGKSSLKVIKCKPIPNWMLLSVYTNGSFTGQNTFGRTKSVFQRVLNSNYQQKCEEELEMHSKTCTKCNFSANVTWNHSVLHSNLELLFLNCLVII